MTVVPQITGTHADVHLTPRERQLFDYLNARRGTAVSEAELLMEVWGRNPFVDQTKTVAVHVSCLRRKLGKDAIWTVDRSYLIPLSA